MDEEFIAGGDKGRPSSTLLLSCGLNRIALGEDQPFMEIVPEVLRSYARAVQHGHRHIHQVLPRMLTVWFDFGSACSAQRTPTNNKVPRRTSHTHLGHLYQISFCCPCLISGSISSALQRTEKPAVCLMHASLVSRND